MSESDEADVRTFAGFGTIMTLLTLSAIIGNILCFRMTRRLLRSKPSMALVLNLNMSDIIVASVSWGAFMLQHIASHLHYNIHVIVHKIFWAILVGLGNATLLTLTGLAADCYIALRWPLHYKVIATHRSVNIYIAVIWICSVLSGGGDFLTALTRTTSGYSYSDAIRESIVLTGRNLTRGDMLTASITMLISNSLSFLCLVTMIVMYGYILAKIRQIHSNQMLSKQGGYKSEIHAVRTTLMIFSSFLLLWLPTLVVNIMSVVKPDFLSKLSFTEASFIGYTADCLLMVHSTADALIYGVRVRKTIGRQRRNRENQAGFSRANTIKRPSGSDSDKADKAPHADHADHNEEFGAKTTINQDRSLIQLSPRHLREDHEEKGRLVTAAYNSSFVDDETSPGGLGPNGKISTTAPTKAIVTLEPAIFTIMATDKRTDAVTSNNPAMACTTCTTAHKAHSSLDHETKSHKCAIQRINESKKSCTAVPHSPNPPTAAKEDGLEIETKKTDCIVDIQLTNGIDTGLQLCNGIYADFQSANQVCAEFHMTNMNHKNLQLTNGIPGKGQLTNGMHGNLQLTNGMHGNLQRTNGISGDLQRTATKHSTGNKNSSQSLQVPNPSKPLRSSLKKPKEKEGQPDKEVRVHFKSETGEEAIPIDHRHRHCRGSTVRIHQTFNSLVSQQKPISSGEDNSEGMTTETFQQHLGTNNQRNRKLSASFNNEGYESTELTVYSISDLGTNIELEDDKDLSSQSLCGPECSKTEHLGDGATNSQTLCSHSSHIKISQCTRL